MLTPTPQPRVPIDPARFWRFAFAIRGTATPAIFPRMLVFAAAAAVITWFHRAVTPLGIAERPVEVSGAVIGLFLVLRTNSGYERWWEARKLWGGIVNQSRNLAVAALAYGPAEAAWRRAFVGWAAALPHAIRHSLRGERELPEAARLIGPDAAAAAASARHLPNHVAARMAELLRSARAGGLDAWAFLELERQRGLLVDHYGACERILKTPLAFAYAAKVRRFIVLYLLIVPFALVEPTGWLTPLITMFIAYPVLALDHIGTELQNPFSIRSLSHLPLDGICETIEGDLLALLEAERPVQT